MNTLLIFGAGNKAKEITRYIDKKNNSIACYIDNDAAKQGQKYLGKKIISPNNIAAYQYQYILIASIYWKEIREQLISLGIDKRKIKCPLARMKRNRFRTEYGDIYNIFGKFRFYYGQWHLKQQFYPSAFAGIFVNPYFFSRKKLYEDIALYAHHITGKCMDFGCGIQPYKKLFPVEEYVGVEIESDHKVRGIVYYDGHTLPFQDEEFDSIISSEVFEHVSNIEEIVIELRRVLKKEGKMLITVPFAYPRHCWPFDHKRYTSEGLKNLLENAGFECIDYKMSSNYQECIAQLKNVYWAEEVTPKLAVGKFIKNMIIVVNNLSGIIGGKIMPYSDKLYLDNVIVVKKV